MKLTRMILVVSAPLGVRVSARNPYCDPKAGCSPCVARSFHLSLRPLLAVFIACASLLAPWRSYAQKCEIKSGTEATCLSPGGQCTENGQTGTCKQLSDECECYNPGPGPARNYSVGGTVSGLAAGNTVTLLDNGGSQLSIMQNGRFTFATGISNGTGYNVTVENQPSGQNCAVSNYWGKIQGANVTNVAVQCITPPDITACDHNGCVSEAQICANVSQSLENPPQVAGVNSATSCRLCLHRRKSAPGLRRSGADCH
jgi:hypothetical protein